MRVTLRWSALARIALAAMLFLCVAATASAAVTRPNALDREVSAISRATLLSSPASALVDPDRQAAAQRLIRWKAPGWLLMVALQIAALAYFWRSGWAARVRDALRRRIRSEFWVRFCFAGALVIIAKLAGLVPQFYLYRVERVMGLSSELARGFAYDWFATLVIAIVVAGFVAAIVLWLADRTHQWYIYTIAGIVAASLAFSFVNPFAIAPLFNKFEPLHSARAASFAALARRANADPVTVLVSDRSVRTQSERALVIGLYGTKRIVLSDTLVAGSDPAELAFYEARELGSLRRNAPLWHALFLALLAIVGATIAIVVADRVGFRRDDDPVSRLALVGALLGCAFVFAVPVYCAYSRAGAVRDDAYAVALTGDRSAAVRAMVRRADQRMEEVCPSTAPMLLFEHAPPIAARVASFNGVPARCP